MITNWPAPALAQFNEAAPRTYNWFRRKPHPSSRSSSICGNASLAYYKLCNGNDLRVDPVSPGVQPGPRPPRSSSISHKASEMSLTSRSKGIKRCWLLAQHAVAAHTSVTPESTVALVQYKELIRNSLNVAAVNMAQQPSCHKSTAFRCFSQAAALPEQQSADIHLTEAAIEVGPVQTALRHIALEILHACTCFALHCAVWNTAALLHPQWLYAHPQPAPSPHLNCCCTLLSCINCYIQSESVLQRIQELSQQDGALVLRLRVDAGGCSGFSYKFDLEGDPSPDDV